MPRCTTVTEAADLLDMNVDFLYSCLQVCADMAGHTPAPDCFSLSCVFLTSCSSRNPQNIQEKQYIAQAVLSSQEQQELDERQGGPAKPAHSASGGPDSGADKRPEQGSVTPPLAPGAALRQKQQAALRATTKEVRRARILRVPTQP